MVTDKTRPLSCVGTLSQPYFNGYNVRQLYLSPDPDIDGSVSSLKNNVH